VSRNVLCNALVEQARTLVDGDWRAAEELTLRALDLNPEHAQAKSVRTLVLDRKREQFVNEFMSQARKMHAAADLAGALSKIDETLLAYPASSGFCRCDRLCNGKSRNPTSPGATARPRRIAAPAT